MLPVSAKLCYASFGLAVHDWMSLASMLSVTAREAYSFRDMNLCDCLVQSEESVSIKDMALHCLSFQHPAAAQCDISNVLLKQPPMDIASYIEGSLSFLCQFCRTFILLNIYNILGSRLSVASYPSFIVSL